MDIVSIHRTTFQLYVVNLITVRSASLMDFKCISDRLGYTKAILCRVSNWHCSIYALL